MIDFNKLAEECRNCPDANTGTMKFMNAFYSLEKFCFPSLPFDFEHKEEPKPFFGILKEEPTLFVFTDKDICNEFAIYNKIINEEGNTFLIESGMDKLYEYMKLIKEDGIKKISINYGIGVNGIILSLDEAILLFEKLVIKPDTKKVVIEKGTKVMIGVPKNKEEHAAALIKLKEMFGNDVESLYYCIARFKDNNEVTEKFIVIPKFKQHIKSQEQQVNIFNMMSNYIAQVELYKGATIYFQANDEIIPAELKNQLKIW